MKKLIYILITFIGIFSFASPIANADEGEATYAVVKNGVVVNVIVCTASVCEGQWHGKMPNDTNCPSCDLVLQVPANPVTGKNQGSFFNPPPQPSEQNRQVYYDNNTKTFSGALSAPVTVTKVEVDPMVTLETKLQALGFTFFADVLTADGNVAINYVTNTSAIVSATKTTSFATVKNELSFDVPQTQEQIQTIAVETPVINSNLSKIFSMLHGWLL